jgi:hypothetical protein
MTTARKDYRHQPTTVKDVFENQHADLDYADGYKSEWDILVDMFEMDSTEQQTTYYLYTATVNKDDGQPDVNSNVVVLHLQQVGRVAILNNAYTTWADDRGDDIETLIDMYYNDQDEWEARN